MNADADLNLDAELFLNIHIQYFSAAFIPKAARMAAMQLCMLSELSRQNANGFIADILINGSYSSGWYLRALKKRFEYVQHHKPYCPPQRA